MAADLKPIKNISVKRTQLFINNQYVDSVSGRTFETINPATEEVICKVLIIGTPFLVFDVNNKPNCVLSRFRKATKLTWTKQ